MAKNDDPFKGLFGGGDDRDDRREQRFILGPGGVPMIMVQGGASGYDDRYRQPSQNIRHADEPPVRVQMAMQFLQLAKSMQAERPVMVPNGEGTAELKILKAVGLQPDESAAQAAAADCLTRYFGGTLPPNIWEKTDLHPVPIVEMTCGCVEQFNKPSRNCPVCVGTGKMRILLDPTVVQQATMSAAIVSNKNLDQHSEHVEAANANGNTNGNDAGPNSRPRSPRSPRQ